MCFAFVLATIIQFASVHFFTKQHSGEVFVDSDEEEEDALCAGEGATGGVGGTDAANNGRTTIVSVSLSVCVSLSLCLSVCLSVSLSLPSLSLSLPLHTFSLCLSVSLCLSLPVSLCPVSLSPSHT